MAENVDDLLFDINRKMSVSPCSRAEALFLLGRANAALADLKAERDRLLATVANYKAFVESEILDRVSAELGVDLKRQLKELPDE